MAGRRCTVVEGENGWIVTRLEPTRPLQNLTPRQFELMLLEIGIAWQDVLSAIDAQYANDDMTRAQAHIEFGRALEFRRNHWAVDELATHLGFERDQLDALWRRAATFR